MKNIVLLCSAGMSTSMLVTKMCNIDAYGLSEASAMIPSAACVLLGPQVRFHLQKLQQQYPSVPMASIDMRMYGSMDGKGVFQQALKLIGE